MRYRCLPSERDERWKRKKTLREGYTTGSCATAATKAALTALITGQVQAEATIRIPIGRVVTFSLASCSFDGETATASVVKDGGDDPDATHGALIVSTVSWASSPGVHIDGGEGVGRVTKPGLPVPVGEAAINPVPRQMIREAVNEVLAQYGLHRGVKVVISVPGGEEIAKKNVEPETRHHWRHFDFGDARHRRSVLHRRLPGEHRAGASSGESERLPPCCHHNRGAEREIRHARISAFAGRSVYRNGRFCRLYAETMQTAWHQDGVDGRDDGEIFESRSRSDDGALEKRPGRLWLFGCHRRAGRCWPRTGGCGARREYGGASRRHDARGRLHEVFRAFVRSVLPGGASRSGRRSDGGDVHLHNERTTIRKGGADRWGR
ncbi:CbiD protein [Geobacillus sp. WSUCF1]|nr:CbiD protein [Geobacillus sp. WSUCF1]